MDFLFSLAGLIILSPFLIVLILIISIYNNGTPFFFQTRPGKQGIPFKIIKFKTMTDIKTVDSRELDETVRITKLGFFLRKFSLDELLQIINVLKGDMSLVGPRPLLMEYVPLYNSNQLKRLNVRPGITGWAQIKGRNSLSWNEKFNYDVWYVENLSFTLDFKILLLTAIKVIKKEGVDKSSDTRWNGN
jgi:lipopolysaccharide/colanic/teichoic acid biosynthesis glycosyltransferase